MILRFFFMFSLITLYLFPSAFNSSTRIERVKSELLTRMEALHPAWDEEKQFVRDCADGNFSSCLLLRKNLTRRFADPNQVAVCCDEISSALEIVEKIAKTRAGNVLACDSSVRALSKEEIQLKESFEASNRESVCLGYTFRNSRAYRRCFYAEDCSFFAATLARSFLDFKWGDRGLTYCMAEDLIAAVADRLL